MKDMDVVDTKTNVQTKTNIKCFKYPMYVIFLKSRGHGHGGLVHGCVYVLTF